MDQELWTEARAIAARARKEADELETKRDALNAQIGELRSLARRIDPPERQTTKPATRTRNVSDAKILEVAETINANYGDGTEAFAPPHVAALLGIRSTWTVKLVLDRLRDMEFVAHAGEHRVEGQRVGKPHQFYRVLDRDVINEIRRTQ